VIAAPSPKGTKPLKKGITKLAPAQKAGLSTQTVTQKDECRSSDVEILDKTKVNNLSPLHLKCFAYGFKETYETSYPNDDCVKALYSTFQMSRINGETARVKELHKKIGGDGSSVENACFANLPDKKKFLLSMDKFAKPGAKFPYAEGAKAAEEFMKTQWNSYDVGLSWGNALKKVRVPQQKGDPTIVPLAIPTKSTKRQSVPPGWHCSPEWYADAGCHCLCGAPDPACNDPNVYILNCPNNGASSPPGIYYCPNGFCISANHTQPPSTDSTSTEAPTTSTTIPATTIPATTIPATTTEPITPPVDTKEVICICGFDFSVADLDCKNPNSTVVGCGDVLSPQCVNGVCVGGRGAPAGWECSPFFYAADDGCDCDCGIPDPDCIDTSADTYNCDPGYYCLVNGTCSGTMVGNWTCPMEYYDAGDGCDCNCGIKDPDCDDDDDPYISGCPCDDMYCSEDGFCEGSCNGFIISARSSTEVDQLSEGSLLHLCGLLIMLLLIALFE
jgi:hypothetical protein